MAYGARFVSIEYEDQRPVRLRFQVPVAELAEDGGEAPLMPVELAPQWRGILGRLTGSTSSRSQKTRTELEERARAVAWRQMKVYVEMLLEMAENELKPLHELFMADVLVRGEGGGVQRQGDAWLEHRGELLPSRGALLLTAGS